MKTIACRKDTNEWYFIAAVIEHADDLEMTEASFAATLRSSDHYTSVATCACNRINVQRQDEARPPKCPRWSFASVLLDASALRAGQSVSEVQFVQFYSGIDTC